MPYAQEQRDVPLRSTPQIQAVRRVLGHYRRAAAPATSDRARPATVNVAPSSGSTPPRAG